MSNETSTRMAIKHSEDNVRRVREFQRNVASACRDALAQTGISHSDLARTLGVSRQRVAQMLDPEHGSPPTSACLIELLHHCGLALHVEPVVEEPVTEAVAS